MPIGARYTRHSVDRGRRARCPCTCTRPAIDLVVLRQLHSAVLSVSGNQMAKHIDILIAARHGMESIDCSSPVQKAERSPCRRCQEGHQASRPPTPASLPSPNRLHKFLLPLGDLNSQFRTRAHGGWHGMRVRPVAGLERKCCLHVCHCFLSRS
jgi:hypothetical protein